MLYVVCFFVLFFALGIAVEILFEDWSSLEDKSILKKIATESPTLVVTP
jgi:hypothetical protein